MKYLKTFEDSSNKSKFEIGDYIVFIFDLYAFGEVVINEGKPYEIINVYDDDGFNNTVVIYDNNNEPSPFNEFDYRLKKIPREEAKFILAQIKYNL